MEKIVMDNTGNKKGFDYQNKMVLKREGNNPLH